MVLAAHHVLHNGRCLLGGAEKYLLESIRALLAAGADVHVAYSGDWIYDDLTAAHEPPQPSLTFERVNWLDAHLRGDRRLRPGLIARRWAWFRRRRPDAVLVVQLGHGGAFGASIVAAKLAGCRVAASIRQPPEPALMADGLAPPARPSRLNRAALRMRIVAACCDALIFNSRRIAGQYAALYGWPWRKIRIIRNAAGTADAGGIVGRREDASDVVVGAVGQVSRTKGADLTLEAFARITPRFAGARLRYVGDGALIDELRRRAAELGVQDRVCFAGFVADRERAFGDLDLFVLPSRRESSSNAVAEAMARGLPCVVSDAGGLPELVAHGKSGLVVRGDDVTALAEAMATLLGDAKLRRRMGAAARQRAAEMFDPAMMARQTVEVVLGEMCVDRERATGRFFEDASS
ncbi:MAG: glycosyltransferase family 4 protein [Phycisphaerae bacterium]|nr:glycosyltransferase family 4 protein [Phycisphaerae bacterium]